MSNQNCIMCNGPNAKLCSSCQSISYCSSTCQRADWPLHKKICTSFTTISTRPSPSHKLSILLPVDSKDPKLVWVKCTRHMNDSDGIPWHTPETQKLLGVENLDPKHDQAIENKKIIRAILRGFELRDTVEVIYRKSFLIDGSTSNVCVQQITEIQKMHDWRGPIVVMRQPGTTMNHSVYEDIQAGDLRVAVDYLLSYDRNYGWLHDKKR